MVASPRFSSNFRRRATRGKWGEGGRGAAFLRCTSERCHGHGAVYGLRLLYATPRTQIPWRASVPSSVIPRALCSQHPLLARFPGGSSGAMGTSWEVGRHHTAVPGPGERGNPSRVRGVDSSAARTAPFIFVRLERLGSR